MVIYKGLVRSWNGTTWHLRKPQTDFCSSADAAGGTVADADTFDAASQTWTSVAPDLGNLCAEFHACFWAGAVSCASPTSCMTLGGPDGSQWWNGTAWQSARAISAGRGSALQGTSCGGGHCLAVGFRAVAGMRRTLAELWNGSTWTIITTPR